jgi:hypothetical protein
VALNGLADSYVSMVLEGFPYAESSVGPERR